MSWQLSRFYPLVEVPSVKEWHLLRGDIQRIKSECILLISRTNLLQKTITLLPMCFPVNQENDVSLGVAVADKKMKHFTEENSFWFLDWRHLNICSLAKIAGYCGGSRQKWAFQGGIPLCETAAIPCSRRRRQILYPQNGTFCTHI